MSREIDLMVEEHIIGSTAWEEKRGGYLHVSFQKPGKEEPYKRSQNWKNDMSRYRKINFSEIDGMKHIVHSLKDYSSNISDAWKVVEKMREEGFIMTVITGYYGKRVRVEVHDPDIAVEAETAPLAICKAALKAKGITMEGEET